MAAKPISKISKELQIKLRPELAVTNQRAKDTILEILKWLEDNTALKLVDISKEDWERRGERYDSQDSFFKANRITLATEKSKLAEIYNLMRSRYADIFLISQPSIFTFQNPVSSQEIKDIFKSQCG